MSRPRCQTRFYLSRWPWYEFGMIYIMLHAGPVVFTFLWQIGPDLPPMTVGERGVW